jgi:hypothetical protein
MGSFQITYDDFSGGQYMGNKSTNLPKNTWHGENVLPTPSGQIIASGNATAANWAVTGTPSTGTIYDHWVIGGDSYVFTNTIASGTSTSRFLKFEFVNDGGAFPITPTAVTLTGFLGGNVAYYPATSLFYYISTAGNIYSVTTSGTVSAAISTALAGLNLTNITSYGYRLLSWGGTNATAKKRLYYSDTTLATWSTANYYEFSGTILNVLPRTNDLLVICNTGVFSLVGVLGSSVTNQLIVPQENITEGMKDATIVGRNMYFLDQLANGSLDGRLYRLTGSTVQSTEVISTSDIVAQTGLEQARVLAINDGRLVIMMRTGICYVETSKGQWSRLTATTATLDSAASKQQQIGRAGPNSLNEFLMIASFDTTTKSIVLNRYIHNAIIPTPTLGSISVSGGGSSGTYPTATVTLSEYWHSKPFTVKEMFIEYSPLTTFGKIPVIQPQIQSTGNVDVLSENIGSILSSTGSNISQLNASFGTYVMERFRTNNADKGFGVKPKITFSAATIKRVILNCED